MADEPEESEFYAEEYFTLEETRRQFVLEHAAPYTISGDNGPPSIQEILQIFVAIEAWLRDGTLPLKPIPTKLKVVGPNETQS